MFKLVDETTTKSIATFRSNLFQSEHNIVVKRLDAYEFTRVSRRKIYGDQMISFFFLSMCVPFFPFCFLLFILLSSFSITEKDDSYISYARVVRTIESEKGAHLTMLV